MWVQTTLAIYETAMGTRDGYRNGQVKAQPVFKSLPSPLRKRWQTMIELYRLPL